MTFAAEVYLGPALEFLPKGCIINGNEVFKKDGIMPEW